MPSKFVPKTLARRDASGQIASQLRRAIFSGVWVAGERLPSEIELAEMFDVARATAREALKFLSAAGLVSTSRGNMGGTYVATPSADLVAEQLSDAIRLWYRAGDVSVQDVDEARWVLEMHCVELAARRRTDADLEAIRSPIDAARNTEMGMVEWLDLDIEFHSAITRAAKNNILQLAMMAVHLSRPATNSVHLHFLDRDAILAQHEAIYDGIARSLPDEALAAFRAHIAYLDEARAKGLAAMGAEDVTVAQLREIGTLPAAIAE